MSTLFEKLNKGKTGKSKSLRSKIKSDVKPKKKVDIVKISESEKNKTSVEIFLRELKLKQLEMVSIVYSVMSRETLERISVCEVKNINKTKDLTNTTEDPRLGTIENFRLCATCEKTNEECPGHLGIINLPENIIHPFFRLIAMRVLQCVCNTCYKLFLDEEHLRESGILQLSGYPRLIKIAEFSKDGKVRCNNGCPANPIFKPQKSGDNQNVNMPCIKKIGKQELPYQLSVSTIKKIFDNISDRDVSLMGFINNHPSNFIVDFVTVMPVSARPYVFRVDSNQKQEDYLTSGYDDIISKVIEYYQTDREKTTDTENDKKEECIKDIIFIYDHSIQNCDQSHRRSPSEPCKSINDRIAGKGSLMRDNLLGKRADYTGRTVLGPNRSISFGEIAPPIAMQKILTVPEIVTIYNYDYILDLSKKGRIDYLCPKTGAFSGRKLKFDNRKHVVNVGDKVGRYSENGDIIIFNRQPTLSRLSFLGYVCDFQDKLSVGIHLSSTSGHNADFDGDEGNIHMLQTIDAQVEGRMIMYSGNNIMNSDRSAPQSGLVFNSLTGGYLLTKPGLVLSESVFYEGIESIKMFTKTNYTEDNFSTLFERLEKYPDTEKFSGRSLMSVLFPKDFCYTFRADDETIKIRHGILISGQLTKAQLGGQPGSIIQALWKQYNVQTTINFISDSNFLLNWYSLRYGLTVSYEDVKVTKFREYKEYKTKKIRELNKNVLGLPTLPEDASELDREEREVKINQMINESQNEMIGEFYKNYLEEDNSLSVALKSKAKGDKTQIKNQVALLGQNYVDLSRPKLLTSEGKRWLPTFHIDDKSIYSRGFSSSSYLDGLNPDEFFAQAQASRVAYSEQQLSTAETGTLQRKMVKAQENLIVTYDGTIRNHNNVILQFNYGAGFDTGSMVFSYNGIGMKCLSFINLKEEIEKENTEQGYTDFDISSLIIQMFNQVNKKYGDEVIYDEIENNINNLDDYQEILTLQNDDLFEMSVDIE